MYKTIFDLIRDHRFFEGISDDDLKMIAGCGKNEIFESGKYIAKENEPADIFYVIRKGKVAIETFVPEKRPLVLQTLGAGEILGWSWLFPPYQWTFDVKAVDEVHAIALNGKCLREKCDADPRLGYDLMKRFARIMTERLRFTRMQILDVYGERRP